jgi:CRISPR-associated helicase Cas3/CRISPR-associated endonuclease Cas3-HD
VWAKTQRDADNPGDVTDWMPLWRHLDDSAAVAGRLWDEWVPAAVRGEIAASVLGDDQRARRLLMWLAGIHDIGKATPAFAVQYPDGAHRMAALGLSISPAARGPERRALRHELAGHICLRRWLADRHGWRGPAADRVAIVVGGHHGTAPTSEQLQAGSRRPELLGDEPWVAVQDEYLDRQAGLYLDGDDLSAPILLSRPAQVLLTSLVIVADWIASNQDFFPCSGRSSTAERLEQAWRELALPRPWEPGTVPPDADALLRARFGRLDPARPVQATAVELAAATADPGLIIVEAPMGEGKTEAALMAAEILAARTGAGGCFVALPTQATSDAMFGRMRPWIDTLPTADARSVFLAHGKASLNDEYRGLLSGRRPASVAVDHDEDVRGARRSEATGWAPVQAVSAVVHTWLTGRKKGVLASFVVGTIDQFLFLALKSRHLVLRHLAFAGKVVVLDEVHAYDVYMSSYLDRALHWLGAYGVPVVLLSATLPKARRDAMIAAYRSGRSVRAGRDLPALDAHDADDAYPLVTATDGDRVLRRVTGPAARSTAVDVELLPEGDDRLRVLGDRLAAELADGGCAVVVHNTVGRVQQTGRYLTGRFGTEKVTVAHARFLAVDRAANDRALLRRFGPPGPDVERPPWHVVVGSQVIEQSLDVDFDLLVTDLAPVDLVLQRMGRLHRHARGDGQDQRPPRLRRARCLLTGVWLTDDGPEPDRGSAAVYQTHPLLRSAAVLLPHLRDRLPVCLPGDIAPLVQTAYTDDAVGPAQWQPAMESARRAAHASAERRREAAGSFQLGEAGGSRAILGWVAAGVGDVDDGPHGEAQVRDGEMSLEVLAVVRTGDGLAIPPWVEPGGGELLAEHLAIEPRQARLLASCALRLPTQLTRDPRLLDQVIGELERDYVGAWQHSALLAGQLVLVLDPDGCRELAGHHLRYTRALGLEVVRP